MIVYSKAYPSLETFLPCIEETNFSYWLRKATFFLHLELNFSWFIVLRSHWLTERNRFWLNHSLSQITWIANPYPGLWVCHLYSHRFSSTLFEFADQDQDCLINKFLFVALFTHIFLYFNKLISHLLSCHSELTQHWICSLIAVFIWTLCA